MKLEFWEAFENVKRGKEKLSSKIAEVSYSEFRVNIEQGNSLEIHSKLVVNYKLWMP